jgi:hypothetical protein
MCTYLTYVTNKQISFHFIIVEVSNEMLFACVQSRGGSLVINKIKNINKNQFQLNLCYSLSENIYAWILDSSLDFFWDTNNLSKPMRDIWSYYISPFYSYKDTIKIISQAKIGSTLSDKVLIFYIFLVWHNSLLWYTGISVGVITVSPRYSYISSLLVSLLYP